MSASVRYTHRDHDIDPSGQLSTADEKLTLLTGYSAIQRSREVWHGM